MRHTHGSVMSHVNESCHVTHMSRHYNAQKVRSHIKKSYHIWRTHAAHSWDMSHMNESYQVCMSQVTFLLWAGNTCGAAISKKSSPHTWICRRKSLAGNVGSGEGYLSPLYFRRKLNMANRDVFTPQSEMCHVTYVNESWHTYEWVISHVWWSHITQMKHGQSRCFHSAVCNESWHMYERVISHVWINSYHTYERVSSHKWDMAHRDVMTPQSAMSHETHMNESCHTYEGVMSHICMRHVTHMNE